MKSEELRMKKLCVFVSLCSIICLGACSSDESVEQTEQTEVYGLNLTTSVNGFEDADRGGMTRTNIAGDAFAVGDRIKLKVICPFISYTTLAETTWSGSADGLWLLEWEDNNKWGTLEANDSVDMMAHYTYSNGVNVFERYEAQQTPHVYTASTWNENVFFMAPNAAGSRMYPFSQYSYIFQANQSLKHNYLKSDLLWAQSYMQTGSADVHLSFNHVMACLKIDISALSLSTNAVVTLEGMPDIDQREVVVGDYYAGRAKGLTHVSGGNFDYSYKQKCSCSAEDNGKVLGVAVINDTDRKAYIYPMTGNPTAPGNPSPVQYVANTGVYTAHRSGDFFYLIVPPCELTAKAKFWIRDGEKRYSYELQRTSFEQGKQYLINITLQ